ncbi:DUF1826 domain-containing protein [Nitrosomonadales bacterium]|nr:DUF1826 domain-containing protein [Nitrosomonadales bacterium]
MNSLTTLTENPKSAKQFCHDIESSQVEVLGDIYHKDTNIVIWKRKLEDILTQAANNILITNPMLQISLVVTPLNTFSSVKTILGSSQMATILCKDIAKLVEMFCYLFNLKSAGLRLTSLDNAMCPRFHVDAVPCRLVTTYQGIATEWLPHGIADRSKLGTGNQGKPDEQSGLFQNVSDIQQLCPGDVALLKGESWEGNHGAGLIHRSPRLLNETHRLLLTIDFMD